MPAHLFFVIGKLTAAPYRMGAVAIQGDTPGFRFGRSSPTRPDWRSIAMTTRSRDLVRKIVMFAKQRVNAAKFVVLVVTIPIALIVANDRGMKGDSIIPSEWGAFFGLLGLVVVALVMPLAVYLNFSDESSNVTARTSLVVVIIGVALICFKWKMMWSYINNTIGFGWFIVAIIGFVVFLATIIWISTDRKAIKTNSNP